MLMNAVIKQIYESRVVEDHDSNHINPFPSATPYREGSFLYRFILDQQCEKTLEIGMAYGLSTLFICQAHADMDAGVHVAIDPMQTTIWRSIGLLNIQRAKLDKWLDFIEAHSYEALPKLLQKGAQFDFVFIDGSHLFDYVLVDFFLIDKMLRVGGYVAFDDIWMPAVRRAVSFVIRNRAYQVMKVNTHPKPWERIIRPLSRFVRSPFERVPVRLRFSAEKICLIKKIDADNRRWNFHRPF
jgi:predicted O-methyltransferase YrrM